jgi:hypothetical protein
MQAAKGRAVIAIAAMVTLAACAGDRDPQLMNLRSGQGPDEFAIVPPKPLELPENLAELPEPTPGGFNRTDQNPEADAVIALGGTPARPVASRRVTRRFTPMRRASGSRAASVRRWRRKTWTGGATTTAASWNACST